MWSKRTKGSKLYRYAIRYCEDAATLDKIAMNKPGVLVRKELLANKALSDESRGALVDLTVDYPRSSSKNEATMIREIRLAMRSGGAIERIERIMSRRDAGTKVINAGLKASLLKSATVSATSYIATKSGLANKGEQYYRSFWLKGDTAISEVLDGLGNYIQRAVLETLSSMISQGSKAPGEGLVDADLAKRLVATDKVVENRGYVQVRNIFNPEAVAGLLDSPTVAATRLLGYQHLSGEDLTRFLQRLDLTKTQEVNRVLRPMWHDKDAVIAVLENAGDGVLEGWNTGDLLIKASSREDPLVGLVIKRLSDEALVSYIAGVLRIGTGAERIWPSPDELGVLLSRARDSWEGEIRHQGVQVLSNKNGAAHEYQVRLLELVPGLWAECLNEKWGDFVWNRLTSSGASEEIILDQMDLAKNMGLNEFVAVLGAMGRALSDRGGGRTGDEATRWQQ